jgi:uncharacterized Fe-S cluster-containing MiaB family protein
MEAKIVQDILSVLDRSDQDKVRSMFVNYGITAQKFEDAFELIKYRLN